MLYYTLDIIVMTVSCQSGQPLFWAYPQGLQQKLNLAKELQSSNLSGSNSQHLQRQAREKSFSGEDFSPLFPVCMFHSFSLVITTQMLGLQSIAPYPYSCGLAVFTSDCHSSVCCHSAGEKGEKNRKHLILLEFLGRNTVQQNLIGVWCKNNYGYCLWAFHSYIQYQHFCSLH